VKVPRFLNMVLLLLAVLVLGPACVYPARLAPTAVPSSTSPPPSSTPSPPSPTPTPLGGGSGQIIYVFQEGDQKGATLLDLRTGAKRPIIAPKSLSVLAVHPLKVAGKVLVIEQADEDDQQMYVLDARDGTEVLRGSTLFLASDDDRWIIEVPPGETDLTLVS